MNVIYEKINDPGLVAWVILIQDGEFNSVTPAYCKQYEASLIGGIADGVILVVRLGMTPRHHVEQTHNTLEALGGNVLGTCLTGAEEDGGFE